MDKALLDYEVSIDTDCKLLTVGKPFAIEGKQNAQKEYEKFNWTDYVVYDLFYRNRTYKLKIPSSFTHHYVVLDPIDFHWMELAAMLRSHDQTYRLQNKDTTRA